VPVSLVPPANATLTLRDRYSDWNLLTRWNRTLSPTSETSLQVYFDRTSRGDTTYSLGLDTFNIDFQHHIAWGPRQDIVWGLGYRIVADGTMPTLRIMLTPQDRKTQLFSAYAQDEITLRPDRLRLSLGARLEHNDYTGFDLEPSARLAWTANSKNMFWGAASGADRTPARTNSDLRVNYEALTGPSGMTMLVSLFGNPNTKNERLTAFEAGYRNTWTTKFSVDSTIFYNRYRDLNTEEPGATILETIPAPVHLLIPTTFNNNMFGETHGFELFANLKAASHWTLSPGYAFLTTHFHTTANSLDTGSVSETQGGSPNHQAQLRSSVSLPKNLQWNASAYFVNRLPALSVPAYTRLDTGLTWRAGERVSVSAVGQNLLKDRHLEYSGTDSTVLSDMMRRNVYAKISWTF